MSKKILAFLVTVLVAISFISCSTSSNKSNDSSKESNAYASTNDKKYSNLKGSWTKDLTVDDFKEKYSEIYNKVKEKTEDYGLKYTQKENVFDTKKNEKESYLYLDQEKPDKNKLESLYFGCTYYGEGESKGQITLKVSLNFDGKGAVKNKNFDFGKTSLAAYSSILTGVKDRNYSNVNKKILETLESKSGEGYFSQNQDGLYEEFVVSKNYIVYTLQTKIYKFSQKEDASQVDSNKVESKK